MYILQNCMLKIIKLMGKNKGRCRLLKKKSMQFWTMEPKNNSFIAQAGGSAWGEVAIDIKNVLKKKKKNKKCWLAEVWDNAFESGTLSQWWAQKEVRLALRREQEIIPYVQGVLFIFLQWSKRPCLHSSLAEAILLFLLKVLILVYSSNSSV